MHKSGKFEMPLVRWMRHGGNTNNLPPLPRLTITHKSLVLDTVYVGAKTDCSFRYGLNCGRDIPVPIIRARKPFPQELHNIVTSRMRGETPFTIRFCGIVGRGRSSC